MVVERCCRCRCCCCWHCLLQVGSPHAALQCWSVQAQDQGGGQHTGAITAAQHSTAQHSTAGRGAALHGMARHGTAQQGTLQRNSVQHSIQWHIRASFAQRSSAPLSATLCRQLKFLQADAQCVLSGMLTHRAAAAPAHQPQHGAHC
jgi:hypothetical protein